jgi:hypothetical protein
MTSTTRVTGKAFIVVNTRLLTFTDSIGKATNFLARSGSTRFIDRGAKTCSAAVPVLIGKSIQIINFDVSKTRGHRFKSIDGIMSRWIRKMLMTTSIRRLFDGSLVVDLYGFVRLVLFDTRHSGAGRYASTTMIGLGVRMSGGGICTSVAVISFRIRKPGGSIGA